MVQSPKPKPRRPIYRTHPASTLPKSIVDVFHLFHAVAAQPNLSGHGEECTARPRGSISDTGAFQQWAIHKGKMGNWINQEADESETAC